MSKITITVRPVSEFSVISSKDYKKLLDELEFVELNTNLQFLVAGFVVGTSKISNPEVK